nr:hypothetical protein KPHV_45890 [Kitasatospora purpeofusca]
MQPELQPKQWAPRVEPGSEGRSSEAGGQKPRGYMYICYICDMSEPVIASMAEVRSHLADVLDRARRDETPTIITRRGKQEAVVIDILEYRRLSRLAEQAEESWLNQLADEAESEGTEGSVSLEEMAALLRAHHA